MIRRYDSIAALRQTAIDMGFSSIQHAASSWYGNESYVDTLQHTATGDLSLVPIAEKLINQLETQIEVPRHVWHPSVAGHYVCVPDAIMGRPTPMRKRIEIPDEHAPITIIYSINSSASISAEQLRKRGTVALALVLALIQSRPVTLHALFIGDGKDNGEIVFTAQINTAPLDLATACYVLTSAGFYRNMGFFVAEKLNSFTGGWPNKFNSRDRQPYMNYLARVLSNNPAKTLVIGPMYSQDPMIDEPVKWINEQISRFTQREDVEQLA